MASQTSPNVSQQEELECLVRIPFPDPDTANMVIHVLKSEPVIDGVAERRIHLSATDDTRCTVEVLVRARQLRALRSTIGSVLEQEKLVMRTVRGFAS